MLSPREEISGLHNRQVREPRGYRACSASLPDRSFHNSFPEACKRVSKLALDALGADASDEDKADAEVKLFKGDITNAKDVDGIFEYYANDGGIFGVIHIAAHKAVGESGEKPIQYYQNNVSATINILDVRAPIMGSVFAVPRRCAGHVSASMLPLRLLLVGHRLRRARGDPHSRDDAAVR